MAEEVKISVLIIANGKPPADRILHSLADQSTYIIAADGGSNICYEKNIYPNFIIGDLDSIDTHVLDHFNDSEVIHLAEQETNDLYKSLTFVRSLKPQTVAIAAAFGKRLDHSLANLILIQQDFQDLPLEFYDDYGRMTVLSGNTDLHLLPGQTVSLFSFLPVYGLTLQGFKYNLSKEDLPNGFNGLSNVIINTPAKITLSKGFLLLYVVNQ